MIEQEQSAEYWKKKILIVTLIFVTYAFATMIITSFDSPNPPRSPARLMMTISLPILLMLDALLYKKGLAAPQLYKRHLATTIMFAVVFTTGILFSPRSNYFFSASMSAVIFGSLTRQKVDEVNQLQESGESPKA